MTFQVKIKKNMPKFPNFCPSESFCKWFLVETILLLPREAEMPVKKK